MFRVILLYLEVILTLVSALHSPCRWNVKHLCACFLPKLQALSGGLSLMEKVSGMKNRSVSRGYRAQNACMRVRGRLTVLCFPSKMRWMLAINSAVTISWRVEASRISSRRLGQNNSHWVCMPVRGPVCVCGALSTVCSRTSEAHWVFTRGDYMLTGVN